MRENPRIYDDQSKNRSKFDIRTRGPSPAEKSFDQAAGMERSETGCYWLAPLPDAVATTLAIHRLWVNHLGNLHQVCSEALWLARPFIFPLELMQQYFSFIFGCARCASAPAMRQHLSPHASLEMRDARSTSKPGPVDADGQCEEMQKAMDVAIDATTEMWVELIHEGTTPEQEKEQRKPAALVAAIA